MKFAILRGMTASLLASAIVDAYGYDALASAKWWYTFFLLLIFGALLVDRARDDV